MKKFTLCIAVLCLSACIPVADFGAYWEKGTVDPALLGQWTDASKEGGKVSMEVTDDKGSYRIESREPEDRAQKDYQPSSARTLTDGPYTFLMFIDNKNKREGAPEKDLVRYDFKEGVLTEFDLNDDAAGKFLKEKYPKAKNITAPKSETGNVEIKILDDETYEILAAIPDTEEYWKPVVRWKKAP